MLPNPTKFLEGRTNISERVFEALFNKGKLFKGASNGLGIQNVEKCVEGGMANTKLRNFAPTT